MITLIRLRSICGVGLFRLLTDWSMNIRTTTLFVVADLTDAATTVPWVATRLSASSWRRCALDLPYLSLNSPVEPSRMSLMLWSIRSQSMVASLTT
ncbi:Uncharacterised protein [Mycobacterium tuberculosis]|nr:Uncharacterised protein [Mycobacterium tuberculosis]